MAFVRLLGWLLALGGMGVGAASIFWSVGMGGCDPRRLVEIALVTFVACAFLVVPGALMATAGLGDQEGRPVFRGIVGLHAGAMIFTSLAMSGGCF